MGYRVGVDIGGSFTDFALFDEATQSLKTLKVFSRPDEPGAEVLEGVRLVGERYGIRPEEISYFTHGTTVGINTVIQRKGLRLALFTTEHFRDVLEIARLKIPDMYNLLSKRAAPLITRDLVFGVAGRMKADGSVQDELDEASVARAVEGARAANAEGIVISFLHAYRNPAHELAAKAIVERLVPEIPVFCSNETWPIIREYERTITAAIGAYVQPRVAHYLGSLQQALKDVGVTADPRLTKSNGGVMTAEQGKNQCVQMILSGTASGVIGASYVAEICGIERCMSLDIGGTSADVAVIIGGQPQYGVGEQIGEFQIFIPSVSVSSIGEGGGSIAWIDSQGVLKVGPESAGSRPGPACYGRGGTRATITDAFAALGLVGLSEIGYSAVTIDRAAARHAVGELAGALGRTIEQTAEAIIRIAVSGMYSDVSALVSRSGIDPREFSCLAFGGAGPMMACFLARELGMQRVLIPTVPGVLSALGGLVADVKNDFISTAYYPLSAAELPRLKANFDHLARRATAWITEEQKFAGPYMLQPSADMRYQGQSFEIEVPLQLDWITAGDWPRIAAAFHEQHDRLYGHSSANAPVSLVSLRMVVVGTSPQPQFPAQPRLAGLPSPAKQVDVYLDGAWRTVPLYRRADLGHGHRLGSPCVVAQEDTTICVPEGFTGSVDAYGNILLSLGQ